MVRVILVLFLGLIGSLIVYPYFITFLKRIKCRQTTSEYSLDQYKEKENVPTMGGLVFIIVPVIIAVIAFWQDLSNINFLMVIFAFISYGLIGFVDDYLIVIKQNNDGLKAKTKLFLQFILALVFFLVYQDQQSTVIAIPFTSLNINFGVFYAIIVFGMFVGSSNAVNLTDGMDGLAAGTSLIAFIPYAIFAIVQKEYAIAGLLAGVIGALLAYLKYNIKPARVFMGDTGSLALGGLLAASALVLKEEFSLIIIGGIFVFETLCVMIQIGSVKLRGKRVFKYTPIHYSWIISGHKEENIVRSFWLVGVVLAIIGTLVVLL